MRRPVCWYGQIISDLILGYGVEDIAIRRKANLEWVRDVVRGLRARGKLADLYRRRS